MELLKLEDYQNLDSKKVIEYFAEINKIPRRSGEEKEIREYLENFAKERNLKYVKDEYENIIIYKTATKGRENEETLALQAHTDMICEKDAGVQHDFSKDPIVLYKEGDDITANGTTLGADNGIGIAQILTVLDSNIKANIEAIFTVSEETSMIGSINFDASKLEGKMLLNLDGFEENTILIESAGFYDIILKMNNNFEKIKEDLIETNNKEYNSNLEINNKASNLSSGINNINNNTNNDKANFNMYEINLTRASRRSF